ncbi:MAG: DUF904 domain-containing protein [Ottowia sp.]
MSAPSALLAQVIDRANRLLERHAELRQTNALLNLQVQSLTQERDSLQSRLTAARARNEELLVQIARQSAQPSRETK